jgi:hypothetical protein
MEGHMHRKCSRFQPTLESEDLAGALSSFVVERYG